MLAVPHSVSEAGRDDNLFHGQSSGRTLASSSKCPPATLATSIASDRGVSKLQGEKHRYWMKAMNDIHASCGGAEGGADAGLSLP